eukprot:1160790-Pelagomonas_calceolata.AAC.5
MLYSACQHVQHLRTFVGPRPGQASSSSAEALRMAAKLPNVMPSVTASVRLMPRTAHRAALQSNKGGSGRRCMSHQPNLYPPAPLITFPPLQVFATMHMPGALAAEGRP